MELSDLGEFGLIDRLRQRLERWGVAYHPSLVVGMGDDAALWQPEPGLQAITVDALVEGVHFRLEEATWQELGWKALAINLSDLAAMGAEPGMALVSLALPPNTQVAAVEGLYEGIAELARQYGVAIIGGNLARSPVVQVHLTAIGHLPSGSQPLTRGKARPGDALAVTGSLGGSAGWLRLGKRDDASLRRAHYRPQPRLAEGRLLRQAGVRAAIDISDGLLADLGKLCQASGVAARLEVDRLPIHPALSSGEVGVGQELALHGGEDYELLFAAPASIVSQVAARVVVQVTIIGEIVPGAPGEVTLITGGGAEVAPVERGWDHFLR